MMPLRSYRYGTHTIGSRLVFSELSEVEETRPTLMFTICRRVSRTDSTRVREWRTKDGRLHASLYQTSDGYLIHFQRVARFHVSKDLTCVRCAPCGAAATRSIRHLFLDQVMPVVLALGGQHVIHASAVDYKGHGVTFVGESGVGKSTMAAMLTQNGSRILADDAVVLEECSDQFMVSAPYPSLRLWEDSATALDLGRGRTGYRSGKHRFPPHHRLSFAAAPSRLGAVCQLSRSTSADRAIFARLGGPEALVMLVRHGFKFDVSGRSSLEREFRFLSRLVASVPCYRLTIPESLEELPSLGTLVLDAIQSARARHIA